MEAATLSKHNTSEDPFVVARLKTTFLFLGFMVLVSFVVGMIADHIIQKIITEELRQGSLVSAIDLTEHISRVRLYTRLIVLSIYAVASYMLLGYTLKPIRELVKAQRNFISNTSHELRTPLTIAKTEIQLLLQHKDKITREEAIAALESNVIHIDGVSRIIQFFLILSDFNTPHPKAWMQKVTIHTVIRAACTRLEDNAEKKGVRIEIISDDKSIQTTGNTVALEKMFLNLIRNAIQHTDSGGLVSIETHLQDQKIIVSVTDTGIGIEKHELSRIFDTFYRGSNARMPGSGVGLSIVREVLKMHSGSIRAESTPGKGTVFIVTLQST